MDFTLLILPMSNKLHTTGNKRLHILIFLKQRKLI